MTDAQAGGMTPKFGGLPWSAWGYPVAGTCFRTPKVQRHSRTDYNGPARFSDPQARRVAEPTGHVAERCHRQRDCPRNPTADRMRRRCGRPAPPLNCGPPSSGADTGEPLLVTDKFLFPNSPNREQTSRPTPFRNPGTGGSATAPAGSDPSFPFRGAPSPPPRTSTCWGPFRPP